MKTQRLREWALECLDKPKTTQEIIDYICSRSRHGTSSHVMNNVLSNEKRIKKIGYIKRVGVTSGAYDVVLWARSDF